MLRVDSTLSQSCPPSSPLVVFAFEKSGLSVWPLFSSAPVVQAFAWAQKEGFEGKCGQNQLVHTPNKKIPRVVFIGLGPRKDATLETLRQGMASLVRLAERQSIKQLFTKLPLIGNAGGSAHAAAEGTLLGAYAYTRYKTNSESKKAVESILVSVKNGAEKKTMDQGFARGLLFAEATNFARDLINQPPSDTTPSDLVSIAKTVAKKGIKLTVLNKQQMAKLGMGALLGVNRGSGKPPFFIHLIYRPNTKPKRRIALCGKGITFDSGGLSLKPAKSMETMKDDMSGAAAVLAIFALLPRLKPAVEIHGFAALTENMPGENALKPGDVLRSLQGKTIEVLNTDAEGRLILADTLAYACRQKPDEIIDVATLTGACRIALGDKIAALMGNNADLLQRLKNSSNDSGEKLWELPLEKEYRKGLDSKVADIKNIGPAGEAGTIMGGLFLSEFVERGLPWAHIDIANVAWTDEGTALSPAGGTGAMVRTLLHYLISLQ